jgi:hypothetical protein
MKFYNSEAEIDAAILRFSKRGQSLQQEAHKIACSVLKRLGETNDVRIVMKFVAGIPEMGRANAVRDWFAHFGPVTFDQKGALFVKGKATRLGEAMDEPFWKFSPEKPYQPVDPAKALEALIKRLKTDQKRLGTDHSELIAGLRAIRVNAATIATEETQEAVVAPLMLEYIPAWEGTDEGFYAAN